MFMQCFEWWAFELIVLMSGAIGVVELAVQTFAISIIVLFYNIPMGYQTAVTFKIGLEIGRKNIAKAIDYKEAATKVAIMQIIMSFLLFYCFNRNIILFLTTDEDVLRVWDQSILVIAMQLIPDQWQNFQQGITKGLGIQDELTTITFLAYWALNLPLAYLMAFKMGFGYQGLWLSMIIS